MQRYVYLVIYPDKFELPCGYFENIRELAKFAGVSVKKMFKIIEEHRLQNNRFYEQTTL